MTPELEQKLRELASEIWMEAYEKGYAAGLNLNVSGEVKPCDIIRKDEPEATYWNDPKLIWDEYQYLIDPYRDNGIVGITRAGESRYSLTLLIKDGNVMMASSVTDKYGKSTELLRTPYTPATSPQQHKYQCEKHLHDQNVEKHKVLSWENLSVKMQDQNKDHVISRAIIPQGVYKIYNSVSNGVVEGMYSDLIYKGRGTIVIHSSLNYGAESLELHREKCQEHFTENWKGNQS